MAVIWAIAKKEFKSFFASPIAYVVLALFLGVLGWFFFYANSFFRYNYADIGTFFGNLPFLLLFFIPAITMRLWAEEKKMGTHEWLMTMPVTDLETVVGKYLGCMMFYTVMLALTFPLPILISILGDPDWGPIWGGYAASLLMGSAYFSIGLFCSSLTKNQILAFLVTVAFSFGLYFMDHAFVMDILSKIPYVDTAILQTIVEKSGMHGHFESVGRGVIDSRDLLYYFSITGMFVFLNMKSLDSRNW